MEAAPHPWPALGVLLLRDGLVPKEDLEAILDDQRDSPTQRISGRRLGEILIERGVVTQTQVAKLVAEQYELPFLEIEVSDIDLGVASRLTEEHAHRFSAVPISARSDGSILVAIADPATVLFSDELRRELGSPPRFAVVGPDAIDAAIAFVHKGADSPVEPESTEAHAGEGVVVDLHAVDSAPPLTHDEPYFGSQRTVAHLWPPLGALLIREGLVSDTELETALAQQRLSGAKRLGEILVDRGAVTRADVARLIAEQYELPFVDLAASEVEPTAAAMLPEEVARRCSALPIGFVADGSLRVAIAEPPDVLYSDELHRTLGVPLSFAVASPDAIQDAIAFVHKQAPSAVEHTAPAEAEPWATVEPEVEVETDALEAATVDDVVEPVTAEVEEAPVVLPEFEEPAEIAFVHEQGPPAVEHYAVEEEVEEGIPWAFIEPETEVETDAGETTPFEEVVEPVMAEVEEAPVVFAEFEEPAEIAFVHEQAPPAVEQYAVEEEVEEATPWAFVEPETEAEADAAETTAFEEVVETPVLAEVEEAVAHEVEEPAEIAFVHEQAPPAVEQYAVEEEVEEATPWAFVEPETEAEADAAETTPFEEVIEMPVLAEVEDAPVVVAEFEEPAAVVDDAEAGAADEVGTAILAALDLGASDIHFTPQRDALVVRARVDGVMRELTAIPLSREAAATRRLKEMGRLDESEHGRPMEGRASIGAGNETIGFQITVLPTTNGEKVTLRVLDRPTGPISLADLGMPADVEEVFRGAIEQPFGTVVACGPTGSGRTTTLYAALQELNTPERTIATIEDPVEYVMPGIDQTDVDPAAGLTFAGGLRTIVRSDPDAILVGELSDAETAQIAVRAVMTGHLVLSTLHCQSAASAVQRLADMGVEPGLLGTTLTCVIAQRLARRICEDCRESYYATATDLAELDRPGEEAGRRLLARGRGCSACGGTGFRGQVGLFEILPLTDEIQTLVSARDSTTEIQRAAVEAGMRTLRADGIRLCLDGVTTAAEVRRVVGDRHT